jgi:anti-sigma factor RsiW
MKCKELVELVTDYLEDAMAPGERTRFEQHLGLCPGCEAYVDQMRVTVEALGTLRPESIPPSARDALLAAFREWKRG